MPAKFYEHDIISRLKGKRKLSVFLDNLVQTYTPVKKVQLNYIFCDDNFLLEINKQYLKHSTLTDIITFDLSESKEMLCGEIYISVERVNENAEKYEVSYFDELHRVIFHGALHLCGFKDKKEADRKIMRLKENECLDNYKQETP